MASSIVKTSHLTLLVRNGFALNSGAQNICSKQFVRLLSDLGSSAKKFPSLKISILGAPYEKGQPHSGLQKTPDLLRQSGLIEKLIEHGHEVKDEGDVTCDVGDCQLDPQEKAKNMKQTFAFNSKLSDKVSEIIKSGRICITLGGDHSIGLGTVFGHAKSYPDEEMCLLWVDAHADMNTPDTSPSGNMHGMPVSLHLKEIFPSHYDVDDEKLDWFKPRLSSKRIAFIGLREIDPHESIFIDKLNIPCFSMREVDELGIREVVRRCLDMINPGRTRPLHVSFDIDSLDPSEAPATGTRVPGGMTLREGLTLLEEVHASGCLRGLDLVEVNPSLAKNELELHQTVEAAKRLILAAAGFQRRNSAI